MKKIKWKKNLKDFRAKIGNVYLDCYHYETLTGKSMWQAVVSICCLSQYQRRGPVRYSSLALAMAKEDAARLVEELLIDCHSSITKEMRCCGVDLG